ncbi:Vms1/Ankzf1 family peptidyl-tRNA hydrolase [Methanocrinis sp.]|uniref:Vms1/Ankzf1 family peptidyl-tRNA hydrolase n=1 Tax=Methanocrinis sp. TaxID=3101522 RepID=UPI003D0AB278
MVDLLGKKKLEEEIERLRARVAEQEEERDSLQLQIERREEKIRKLTAAGQETSLALKAAEQKIAALQERDAGEEGWEGAATKGRPSSSRLLKPREVEQLLERLDAVRSPHDDLLSAYIAPGSAGENLPPEVGDLARQDESDRGAAVFSAPLLFTIALVPPFPIGEGEVTWAGSFKTGPLKEMLDTPVLVVAAHAGETLLGVALGREGFAERAVVKSAVKEKHTKGGWSQKRFERLREEEIRQHADLVAERLPKILEGYRSIPARAVVSGDPALVKMIAPAIDLPIQEAKIGRFDKKNPDRLLEEVYGFVCLRG